MGSSQATQQPSGQIATAIEPGAASPGMPDPRAAPSPAPLLAPHLAGVDFASGIRAPWKKIRRTPAYTLGLVLAALVMILVPIVYLAIVAAVGWGVYLHTVNDWSIITASHLRGRAAIIPIAIYIAPIVAGGILVLILLKPILIPVRSRFESIPLEPFEEPTVYAFVELVCRLIGAPVPRRIDLDGSVNASASFRGGLLSIFRRGDLVLTIGTPLVAGMSLNQFAGVLAHEFGHFSQGAGMRASYLSATLGNWLIRASCYRDAWEEGLHAAAASGNGNAFLKLIAILVSIGSWISRIVIRILLWIAAVISSYMSRRMEFDADRHEVRFCGSREFETAFRRIVELQHAFGGAMTDVADYWKRDQLPDDMSALVAARARRPTPEVRALIDKEINDSTTGLFAWHPSTASRVRAARKLDEQGIYHLDLPATALFRDFASASKKASYALFKGMVGGRVFTTTFVPVGSLVAQTARHEDRIAGMAGYLGIEPPTWRPFFLPITTIEPSEDPRKSLERLKAARARIAELAPAARTQTDAYTRADQTLVKCEQAPAFFQSGLGKIPRSFELPAGSLMGISPLKDRATNELAGSAMVIDELFQHGAARACAALRILHTKGAQARIDDAQRLRERSAELVGVLAALREIYNDAKAIRIDLGRAQIAALALQKASLRDQAKGLLRPLSDTCRDGLDAIRRKVGGVMYPFENPGGRINLGERLIGATPAWREFEEIFTAASYLVERYPEDVRRITAELVEIAATVEKSLARPRAAQPADA